MNDLVVQPNNTTARAARPALVEYFAIEGLYGYRNISLSSSYAATILIARNGTGKTTLLGALDAFLKLQLTRLKDIQFDRIVCRLRGCDDQLIMTHDDIDAFLEMPSDAEFHRTAVRCSLSPETLFHYIVHEFPLLSREDRRSHDDPVSVSLRSGFSYNIREQDHTLEKLREFIFRQQPNVARAWEAIRFALADTEVVYLPTYRRVELALLEDVNRKPYGPRKSPKFNVAAGSLYTGDIQFGLSDISDRLAVLNSQVVAASNNGYREISANIINDLIDGSFANQIIIGDSLPSKEELSLFFSRLKDNRRVSPFPTVNAPNLDKLYTAGSVPQESEKFLPYFLAQLGRVIESGKAVEAPIDDFVNSCNSYLQSAEPSTHIDGSDQLSLGDDSKVLRLNRRNLSVFVESESQGRKISLDALSSGEKQMISLFAKLYLYPKKKIVLIDEPELSLSIDWQAKILVDVLNAPLCEQVIAITHSPFVFDNELDPFAKSVQVSAYSADHMLFADEDAAGLDFDDGE